MTTSVLEGQRTTQAGLEALDRQILGYLRTRSTTVANIAQHIGRSIPSVTSILRRLMRNGWVMEMGEAESTGGRRPKLYSVVPDVKWALGVDIGRRSTRLCAVDLRGNVLATMVHASPDLRSSEPALETILGWIEEFVEQSNQQKERCMGAAVALPGLVDSRSGVTTTYFAMDRPLRDILADRLQLPVLVVNDARAMAYGEYVEYRHSGIKDLLFVNMGYGGIGMGIIMDGRLHFGSHRHAGEFGHLTVDPQGELCICGKRGCLETVCSGSAMVRSLKEKLENNEKSTIHSKLNGDLDKVDTSVFVEAIHSGDQLSIDLLMERANVLGRNLAVLYTLFDPELVVIGGYISSVGKLLIDTLRAAARASVIPNLANEIEIVTSKLGDLAAALGAARLLLEPVFEEESMEGLPGRFIA